MIRRRIPNRPPLAKRETLKLGGRMLRKGDLVKIRGERGEFRICSFTDDGTAVNCRGGCGGRVLDRTFFVERIGVRKARAAAEEEST